MKKPRPTSLWFGPTRITVILSGIHTRIRNTRLKWYNEEPHDLSQTDIGTPAASQTCLTISVGSHMRQEEVNCAWLFSSKSCMDLQKYHPQSIWHRQHQEQDSTLPQVSAVLYIYRLLQVQLLPLNNTIMEPTASSSSWESLFGILQEGAVDRRYLLIGTFHPSHEHTPKWWVLSCVGRPGCPGTLREVGLVTLDQMGKKWLRANFLILHSSLFCNPVVLVYKSDTFLHSFLLSLLDFSLNTIKELSSVTAINVTI